MDSFFFRCPICSGPIDSNLNKCPKCYHSLNSLGGVLDFVINRQTIDERGFYDNVYNTKRQGEIKRNIDTLSSLWNDHWHPEDRFVWDMVGDIAGKTVLLLGNGDSPKELYFLKKHPGVLVYSDLSAFALRNIKENFDLSTYMDIIRFAAIDAYRLPFFDDSIDIIYAYAMVHHLSDLKLFLNEVVRILVPGGRAIFVDDAYSPIWHYTKQTILKPLMLYSHRMSGISPEDYRFSMTGGFREPELAEMIVAAGGQPWFRRTSFLQYFWYRGTNKLFKGRLREALTSKTIARIILNLDNVFARIPIMQYNLIRLVWGLIKCKKS